jgi:hypothetical protein
MNCAIFASSLIIILSVLIVILMMIDSKKESYKDSVSYRGFTRDHSAPPLSPFVTYKKYACPCNPQYILQQPYEFII